MILDSSILLLWHNLSKGSIYFWDDNILSLRCNLNSLRTLLGQSGLRNERPGRLQSQLEAICTGNFSAPGIYNDASENDIACFILAPSKKKITFSTFSPLSRVVWDFSSNSSISHWFLQYYSFSVSAIHECDSTEAVMIFAGFQLFLFGLRWPGYQPGQQFSMSVITFLLLLPFSWTWKFGICSSLTLVKRTAN